MFHWDNGLKLTTADLAIDFRRRQPRAFVSHAHSDHMARHELALCTPETAALYQLRLGPRRTQAMPYRQPLEWAGVRLTTFPAGHCFGSAMLLAEDGERSLLYTGDFKLRRSLTAAAAELPHADTLVIESTYGDPAYRLPPREETIAEFITLVRRTLAEEKTPVIQGYVLGKSQEVTRILTSHDIPVLQHGAIYEVSRKYEELGCALGRFELFRGAAKPGWAVIMPVGTYPGEIPGAVRFAVTGWAMDRGAKFRLGVDHAIPLSDHADYDELLEAIDCVAPREIYCTHGPESFVDRLLDLGYNAYVLGKAKQGRLF
jgi:Cft2 family RNA processing exonuclease